MFLVPVSRVWCAQLGHKFLSTSFWYQKRGRRTWVVCHHLRRILSAVIVVYAGVDQPGFTRGCNYLLPVDITLKLDKSATTDGLLQAKKGLKVRKPAKGSPCL